MVLISDPVSLSNNLLYGRLFTYGGINELALSFAMHLLDEIKDLSMLDRISSQVKLYQISISVNYVAFTVPGASMVHLGK